MRRDPRGRCYFLDHNTRTTTWQRPSSERLQHFQNWSQMRSQILLQGKNRFLYNQHHHQNGGGLPGSTGVTAGQQAAAAAAVGGAPVPPHIEGSQILHGDVDDASLVEELGPLPDGWERRVRPDGERFARCWF